RHRWSVASGGRRIVRALGFAALAFALLAGAAAWSCASGAHNPQAQVFALTQISRVNGLAPGPDGRMWFTLSDAKAVGAVDLHGNVELFQNATNIDADGQHLAAGPDGALWITQVNPHMPVDSGPDMIGRITTD